MPQLNTIEIRNAMKKYGLPDPSPAELGMFEGLDYVGGGTAIANYVNTKTQQMKAEANSPLLKFVQEEKIRRQGYEDKANQLYQQLQQTISAAPKLFGSLSPEQINQYLAPIAQATREGSANLEGDFARRNLAGSSIEANALADVQRKYRENVLQTGLGIGMNTQKEQATAIQARIAQLFGAGQQSGNLIGAGAGQLSTEAQNNLQTMTQLPMFLKAVAQQDLLFSQQQQDRKASLWDKIDRGINTAGNVASVYYTGGLANRAWKDPNKPSTNGQPSTNKPVNPYNYNDLYDTQLS